MGNKNGKSVSFLVKVSLVFFIIFAGIISWSIFKQTIKNREIQKEISKLEKERLRIIQENDIIRERLAYFESQEYKEKEAKEKLNLKKADENVVIVKPGIIKKDAEEEEEDKDILKKEIVYKNNFQKWWEYFFITK